MSFHPENPLIVQSDRTILLETASPRFEEARDALSLFAEIVKSPEHIHTYRVTPLSLWNAAALGATPEEVKETLLNLSKYEVPANLNSDVEDFMARYGRLKLIKEGDELFLISEDEALLIEISRQKSVIPHLVDPPAAGKLEERRLKVKGEERGLIKSALIRVGFPVEDLAGYTPGTPMDVDLRETSLEGEAFGLRDYQNEAVGAFWAGGSERGGSGTIVLPCGAGKTVVGIGAMASVKAHTLVLTTNVTALRQWRDEILDKSDLDPEDVGEYSGDKKEVKPVTITTYQMLTYRPSKDEPFKHFHLFNEADWGLIIYDEVHLLPAPVFRAVANLQSRRRLGLTATLVREDGKEEEVFSLIGPKKYDVPWRVLEKRGYIASATCTEIRVPFPDDDLRLDYAIAESRDKYRIAACNPGKNQVVNRLLKEHEKDQVLIIGQYLDQLHEIAEMTGAPVITGQTPQAQRDILYEKFRKGEEPVLVVSKVANFAVDLPDANVAIQVSGTFGSRQEEAQRLGRVLRPKKNANTASFYTIVTRDSSEQDFSNKRQLFLTEQGYRYKIETVELDS
ncbi:DEAD/DEAH box helicase [Microvenator marinus]|uniref:DNA 3'-5' helicase n=1 Tax=Microvenator marinus TaxID=2600177 RepID=A0A5B8XPM1_9DELT|nr:DNA repair helicase XPB [Microvenator marinus]QED27201.1 DEAD/DEAH box helicase [Microvenator marinus]